MLSVSTAWMQTTRYGRVDVSGVCCTSDSLLSGAVTSHGGRAVQDSHWNGFDLTTKVGTVKLKGGLLEKRPRVVWLTNLCTTQNAHTDLSPDESSTANHRIF